jgi:hypothetical protein
MYSISTLSQLFVYTIYRIFRSSRMGWAVLALGYMVWRDVTDVKLFFRVLLYLPKAI